MTFRTVVLSSFDDYLAYGQHSGTQDTSAFQSRIDLLANFPNAVMLQLSFAELDYANRWCWQHFGPPHRECVDAQSEYVTCHISSSHCHLGTWTHEWYEKTDYNFGFNEWYFSMHTQYEKFQAFIPMINWGERFPR